MKKRMTSSQRYQYGIVFYGMWFMLFSVGLPAQDCRRQPPFITQLGFDPYKSALSSQVKNTLGVKLVQLSDPANPNSGMDKVYQDSSWKMAGYCGAITLDHLGNAFVIPAPMVNMLYNLPEKQNTLYKIDGQTGMMSEYLSLPMEVIPHEQNPYGLLGSFLDCDNHALIVSSLAGSDRKRELGNVFCVDLSTKNFFIILKNTDVLGVAIGNIRGKRVLIYGKARESEIWSMPLSADNQPVGEPRFELSLAGLGPQFDDKARKIRIRPDGGLDIYGISFYYNLTAPHVRKESLYQFGWNEAEQKWVLMGIK